MLMRNSARQKRRFDIGLRAEKQQNSQRWLRAENSLWATGPEPGRESGWPWLTRSPSAKSLEPVYRAHHMDKSTLIFVRNESWARQTGEQAKSIDQRRKVFALRALPGLFSLSPFHSPALQYFWWEEFHRAPLFIRWNETATQLEREFHHSSHSLGWSSRRLSFSAQAREAAARRQRCSKM